MIGDLLAAGVRYHRQRQGLRQEDLAGRTRALGHPVSRVAIVKIESGGIRAQRASLADVLALAAALDVPPPLLFLPVGLVESVQLLPGLTMTMDDAVRWVSAADIEVVTVKIGASDLGQHIVRRDQRDHDQHPT